MYVVMPKRRAEVVAERSKRLAREAIDGPQSPSPPGEPSSEGSERIEGEGEGSTEQEGTLPESDEEIHSESPVEEVERFGEREWEGSPDSMGGTTSSDNEHHISSDHNYGPSISSEEHELELEHRLEQELEHEQEHEQGRDNIDPTPVAQVSSIPLLEAPAEIIEYERPPDSPSSITGEGEFEFDTQSLHDIDERDNEQDEDEDEEAEAEGDEDSIGHFDPLSPIIGREKITPPPSLSPPLPFIDRVDHLPPTPPQDVTDNPSSSPSIFGPMPTTISELPKPINDSPMPPPPLGTRDLNINKADTPTPTLNAGLKKQKSLKQLLSFGLSSPPPPVPALPHNLANQPMEPAKKRMTLLSRQSKPSLKVDIKKVSTKEGLNSASLLSTPVDLKGKGKEKEKETGKGKEKEERPRMVKRFSLSNMSSAFKKMASGSTSPIPKVPDLPAIYRRKSDQDVDPLSQSSGHDMNPEGMEERPRRRSDDLSFRAVGSPITHTYGNGNGYSLDTPTIGSPIAFELSPPILPRTAVAGPSTRATAAPPGTSPTTVAIAPTAAAALQIKRLARSTSFSSVSSVATSAHPDTEPHEQQTLIAISPRTQRDPSASLQDYLTRVHSTEVTITQPRAHIRQHSLEATIVLSSPPPPLPKHRLMEREDSLKSLSSSHRSSGESQNENLKTPLVMPVASMSLDEIRRHIPIAPPRTVTVTVEGMGSSDSFQSLPSLGSGMVVVNSPTSTLASTSTGPSTTSKSTTTSRTSTPKARSLVRMITSPRRRQSKGKGKGKKKEDVTTTPPVTSASTSTGKGFDSIKQNIKLESLHFEALNLDFSSLDWDSELSMSRSKADR